LGIGTNTPGAMLHLEDTAATLKIRGINDSASYASRLVLDRVDDYRGAGV